MKYIVILADGMADYPVEALGGKTPMEVADKPCMDDMAKDSEVFLVKTVPDELKPGSDVANLSVLGYDTAKYYTGRSPLEAASIGVTLEPDETAFRANLVTLSGSGDYSALTMEDYSSDEITTAESHKLIAAVQEKIVRENIRFYPGISYRHLMVWKNAPDTMRLTPPHDISGRPVAEYLPDEPTILEIMQASRAVLRDHPVNIDRRARGLHTADSLWVWGEGKKPMLADFYELYGKRGAVISAVDLVRGIGKLAGMDVLDVENVTGTIRTNFDGKARAAVDTLLGGNDLVYVHMEAPDECGHRGEIENKVKSIAMIDEKVVQYIRNELTARGIPFKMMIMPDHPTPLCTRTHARDPVPCMIYNSTRKAEGKTTFTEKSAAGTVFEPGCALMRHFLQE